MYIYIYMYIYSGLTNHPQQTSIMYIVMHKQKIHTVLNAHRCNIYM